MRRPLVGLAAIACAFAALECGGRAPVPPLQSAVAADEPRWEDAFDKKPELMVVVFPAALRSDRVYGPLLRRVIDLARERSRVVAETRALDAMEDAEEVIVGMRPDSPETRGDVVVVVRGVRADVDPATLVDADGRPLWAPGPAGHVRELVRSEAPESAPSAGAESPVAASLFELPGRTWVIASGEARAHARAAFAHSIERQRPPLRLEPRPDEVLAAVRIDGPALVERIRALQPTGALGAVGHRLDSVTFELAAGPADTEPAPDGGAGARLDRAVKATLSYTNEDAAALAEATARKVLEALGRKKPEGLAWLSGGNVTVERQRPGHRVVMTAPLPPGLLGALLHAGTARLPALDASPSP